MIFALMAIVLLALSAIALTRSVDTANMTAGNQAFMQRSVLAAEYGVSLAMNKFDTTSTPVGALSTSSGSSSDSAASCYKSTLFSGADASTGSDPRGVPKILLNKSTFDSTYPTCKYTVPTGEVVRYVIDRTCSSTGVSSEAACNVVSVSTVAITDNDKQTGSEVVTPFRVTARVDGARNTLSFVQVVFRP